MGVNDHHKKMVHTGNMLNQHPRTIVLCLEECREVILEFVEDHIET